MVVEKLTNHDGFTWNDETSSTARVFSVKVAGLKQDVELA